MKKHERSLRMQIMGALMLAAALSVIVAEARGQTPETCPASASKPDAVGQYAWRSEKYTPPNFEKFFPVDPAGGAKLDVLWHAPDRNSRSDKEILDTVRAGLRRTRQHRSSILAWIGNRYVWNKSPQNPEAIEIMYHAADSRGQDADVYRTRHYAVYFGLSVVQPKTPAILRALADLCMDVDDPNDLGRIAWGTRRQRDELLQYLQPYLKSDDAAVREKAQAVEKMFKGELNAFEWSKARRQKRARKLFADKLPQIKKSLAGGDAAERQKTLCLINAEGIALILDDAFLPAFAACAEDADRAVRNEVARIVGGTWIWGAKEQNPQAIALLLKLSRDEDHKVRYNAVYFGLSTVRDKDEAVVRRLLEMAFADREPNLYRRIAWGLRPDRALAQRLLNEYLKGDDPTKAKAAREVYRDIVEVEPPQ